MIDINNPEISIILPTYNERENINDLICEINLYITNHVGKSFEFIVVDDDSLDKTWEAVQNRFSSDSGVRVIRRIDQKGLASAISRGIQESRGNIIAWMDCDFSMPPHKLAKLINRVYEGYDIAFGSRFIRGGKDVRGLTDSWSAVILSRLMNNFIRYMLDFSLGDYTSGFVAAKRDVFDKIKIKGDYGEYFIDFIHRANKSGYKIIEIPYYCLPRRAGTSKTGNDLRDYIKKGWKYILLALKLRFTKNVNTI